MYPTLTNGEYIKIAPVGAELVSDIGEKLFRRAINETACDILQLCDGTHSINDIASIMSNKYQEDYAVAEGFVRKFINQSVEIGTLNFIAERHGRPALVFGSTEYWIPEVAIMELTKRCLLKCRHCYLNAGGSRMGEMRYETLLKLYSEMVNNGVSIIQLTGGEPLLYSRFSDLLDMIAQDRTDLIVMIICNE